MNSTPTKFHSHIIFFFRRPTFELHLNRSPAFNNLKINLLTWNLQHFCESLSHMNHLTFLISSFSFSSKNRNYQRIQRNCSELRCTSRQIANRPVNCNLQICNCSYVIHSLICQAGFCLDFLTKFSRFPSNGLLKAVKGRWVK